MRVDSPDSEVRFIYEPVQDDLDQVVQHLRDLAARSGSTDETALLDHAVVSGGKMVRPVVTLLASRFHPCEPTNPITMATAVELLHVATLVHDDTVDRARMRRGRGTVSSVWGTNVAVLLGDYVFATSATYVCDTNNIRVIRRFSETIMELARGQLAEYFSTHGWEQTIADYESRIYNKTASLFCTSGESGAVLSGAPEDVCQALKDYGQNIGMAFQIMDDILDFEGTEAELGKPVGTDLLQGILTLPALLFAEHYPDDPVLRRLRGGSRAPEDLSAMVQQVRNSPVMDETLAMMDGYRRRAREALSKVGDNRARQSLEALTDYVTHRRS